MKIINIASSDSFEDILEAVKDSDSDSIILVVPKSNLVFKNKSKADQLKENFEKLGKEVSIIPSGKGSSKAPGPKNKKEDLKDEEIYAFYSEKTQKKEKSAEPIKTEGKITVAQSVLKDSKKLLFIFLALSLFALVFFILTSISSANIEIIPRKNDFSINIPIIISDKISQIDPVYGMIPGELIHLERTTYNNFTSTGRKEVFQKANGRITIYNNYSTSPQVLVATTRFQTSEGLVFRIPSGITVPGATKDGNALKPGKIEAEVIADRAGEEYNIEASQFKIPGFLGTPKYKGFYAESFNKFSGGFVGPADFITKEDFVSAEEMVKQEALAKVKEELNLLSNYKILEETLDIKMEITGDSNKSGDLAKEFRIGIKTEITTIAFKESDIINFISQYVIDSQNLKVLENGLKISYNEAKLDKGKMELSLKLEASGQAAQNIDKEKITLDILGKRNQDIKNYLSNIKEIDSAKISLFPFWIRSAPKNINRVDIDIINQ